MFPEPRIDLKKDQEKSLFLRLCKFLDAHRLILMIPQLQIKFRTFLNQSKTLAAGYSLNKTKQTNNKQAVHRLREEDHTGMTWVWDQHCHLLAMNSCIKPGNRQRKEIHFFLFSSKKKKKKLRGIFPPLEKDLSRQTLFETYTTSQLDTVFHSTFPSLGVDA